MTEKSGLWMYCITEDRGETAWDCPGIHGTSPVFSVSAAGLTAVVSEEPMKKYPLMRDYLIAHQRVNEVVMRTQPVLPVKFCTIAESKEKIVAEVLVPKAPEFRKMLLELEDKEECGLRANWRDLDQVFRKIGETDERILKKKERLLTLPEEKKRYELIDIGHLVQDGIRETNERTADQLLASLSPLSSEMKKNKTLGDAMILNTAFLVTKEKGAAFDQAVRQLDEKYGNRIHLKYIGPVPPFNFVEIVIRWNEEEGERRVSAG